MSTVDVTVKVSKEAHELAQAVKAVVVALLAKKPITQVIAEEFAAVSVGVQGVEKIPAEMKEDMAAFVKAFALAGADIAEAVSKKKAAPEAPKPAA
jgi:phenylpyruvate tautomerase PptA (4-oxalocrotonate tautomerase family)